MKTPASSGDNLRCLFLSAYPTPPFSFTIRVRSSLALTNATTKRASLAGDGTKFITFDFWILLHMTDLVHMNWNNVNSVNGVLTGQTGGFFTPNSAVS